MGVPHTAHCAMRSHKEETELADGAIPPTPPLGSVAVDISGTPWPPLEASPAVPGCMTVAPWYSVEVSGGGAGIKVRIWRSLPL